MTTIQLRKNVKPKLPPEGQKWLNGMSRGELEATQEILDRLGEETFIRAWTIYKEQLDEIRHTLGHFRYR